ncbi:hypothetical protein HAX54_045275 [Datura stramonium]|uniref:Uncharacterized protein n=1 Tax=Datura stramonium TaxID=4076 RepID=A0ABS8RHT9_DATST|nr:hypothetical protein [Datura stramonium]
MKVYVEIPSFMTQFANTSPPSKSRTKKLLQIIFLFAATAIVTLGLVLIIVIRRYPRKYESPSNVLLDGNLIAHSTAQRHCQDSGCALLQMEDNNLNEKFQFISSILKLAFHCSAGSPSEQY